MSPVVFLIGAKGAGKSHLAPTFSYAGSPLATIEGSSVSSKKSALDISIHELRPDQNLRPTIDQLLLKEGASHAHLFFVATSKTAFVDFQHFVPPPGCDVGFIWNNFLGREDNAKVSLQVTEIKTFDHDDHLAMTDVHQKMMRLVSQPVVTPSPSNVIVTPSPSNDIITTILNFVRNTVQTNCGMMTARPLEIEPLNRICSTLRSVAAKLKELAPNFRQLNLESVAAQFEMACKGLELAQKAVTDVRSSTPSVDTAVENHSIVSDTMQQASHIFEEILKTVSDTMTALHQAPNQQQQHSV